MTDEKSQVQAFGELVAAVGKLIVLLGVFGVFVFIAYALLHG